MLTKGEDGYYSGLLGSKIRFADALDNFEREYPYRFKMRSEILPAEMGHPVVDHLQPNEMIKRIAKVDMDHTCGLLKDVRLDRDNIVDERIPVLGSFKPTGPLSEAVIEKMAEGLTPIFGMRGLQTINRLDIITFDVIGFE